jgi:predicted membrane protein
LEYLRIVKSFVLWGFLLSIPFLVTSYWILKHVFAGYRAVKQDQWAYKLKELESAENIVYDKVPTNGGKGG